MWMPVLFSALREPFPLVIKALQPEAQKPWPPVPVPEVSVVAEGSGFAKKRAPSLVLSRLVCGGSSDG